MYGRHRDARPRHAERMAERNRAAVRVHMLGIVRQPELAHDGEPLRGEGFVQLDHVEIAIRSPSRSISLRVEGTGPMPMMRGGTPPTPCR